MEHFVSSLVILAASILEISCEKTNKQTNGGENPMSPRLPPAWVLP